MKFMNYTNEQLRRTLAKMLTEKTAIIHCGKLHWLSKPEGKYLADEVLDTELLQLCWDVEETLSSEQCNNIELKLLHGVMATDDIYKRCWHATWQQRTIALAKTLGVEIV